MQTPWEYRYAHRTQRMGSSVIRELLKFTEQPDLISFAGGLPAPEVFPLKEFQEAQKVRHLGVSVGTWQGVVEAVSVLLSGSLRSRLRVDRDANSRAQRPLDLVRHLATAASARATIRCVTHGWFPLSVHVGQATTS